MLIQIKKFVRKIPFLSFILKVIYDWRQNKKLMKRVGEFTGSAALPYEKDVPPGFGVGHEPTIRCNLRCKMCYQAQTRSLRQDELSTIDIFKIYEKLQGKVKEIKLVGGEPFARHDILDLIKFWDERKTAVSLQTNLTLVNASMVEKLKEFKNIKAFLTSLDGPKYIHDAVRGVPGAFEKMTSVVFLIKKNLPWAEVSIFSTMLIGDNFNNLSEVVDAARELGIGSVQFLFEQVNTQKDVENSKKIFENKLGWPSDSYRINTQIRDELFGEVNAEKIKKGLGKFRRYGADQGCYVNLIPLNFYKNLEVYLGRKNKRIFCTKLLSPQLRIVQFGDIVWCDIIEKTFGNLLDKSPEEIWLSKEFQDFRKFLKNGCPPICRRCCKAVYVE